jgi:hypothetical protein
MPELPTGAPAPTGDAAATQDTQVTAPAEGGEGTKDTSDDAVDTYKYDGSDPEVVPRKTAKDFIIERQQRKIAKMQSQGEAKGEEGAGDATDDADSEEPSQLEALRPIVEEHLANRDAQEVTEFLNGNPDFAPFTDQVEKWMKHESRRHIPVNELFFAAAGNHLMKIGADRARKADREARETQTGGAPNRESAATIDWATASKEQLEAEKHRIRTGR